MGTGNLSELTETAGQVKDRNFRIQVNTDGIHVYNRDGLHSAADPFDLYPKLEIEADGGHAFYLPQQGRQHRLGSDALPGGLFE